MRQRVMIAMALSCEPALIIADEPTTALDVTIQAQILELMQELSRRLDVALIIITHNLGIVARYRRPGERDVCRAHRRTRPGGRDLFASPQPPVHDRAPEVGAAPGPPARRHAAIRSRAGTRPT